MSLNLSMRVLGTSLSVQFGSMETWGRPSQTIESSVYRAMLVALRRTEC